MSEGRCNTCTKFTHEEKPDPLYGQHGHCDDGNGRVKATAWCGGYAPDAERIAALEAAEAEQAAETSDPADGTATE